MSDRITQTSDPFYASQCEGKVAFKSRLIALDAANRKVGRIVYRCRCCHLWHAGTSKFEPKKPYKRQKRVQLVLETEDVND